MCPRWARRTGLVGEPQQSICFRLAIGRSQSLEVPQRCVVALIVLPATARLWQRGGYRLIRRTSALAISDRRRAMNKPARSWTYRNRRPPSLQVVTGKRWGSIVPYKLVG